MSTTWNHRVIRHQNGDVAYYQIHEVYYDEQAQPESVTQSGVAPGGETMEALREELERMTACLSLPVLDFDSFKART